MLSTLKSLQRIYNLSKPARRFGRGERPLPVLLQVQTTSFCNGRCVFCPYPQYHKRLPQGKMEWDTYKKIVDECVTFPSLRMFSPMLQNEPLLDKDICRVVSYFKEKDGGRVPVFIVTNGYPLTPDLIRGLVGSGLDHLIISLNAGKKETYEQLMPGFKFEKLLSNIENLLASDLRQMRLTLRFLENNKNRDEVGEASADWKKKGVHTEVLSFISNRADTIDIEDLRPSSTQMLWASKLKQKAFSLFSSCCILPFYQMNILFNGDVLLCCNDWQRDPVMGNVMHSSLREIWNGPKAERIKTEILGRRYGSIQACRGCSVTRYFDSWS
jgi:MoaA/NifB/PqqE/SkfB family radical SAM enzyme